MNTVVINIKTDPKVKKEAKKIASDLGLTLSGTINGFLKQFIRNKSIFFTLDESNPSNYLLSSIEESKKERKEKEYYSFKNNEESLNFLDKQ
ncbi:MAG: type II toxin-antitoxin system antitoxin, RelB/DinJ family [Candidatus Magasanikbacteria bacterium CG10_big_fil_rev_8_21_14_0_10_40_10]|uniref:Type II toxin-antitoxin system antitoxin, RelB/DinJ family n=1 Tax=Candidatus Magasanikbacteria bacterium CG10_big_fil_rev_8_21_14_0_10_40_10 TaxID=1974648 RepID=A0A2M6W3R5_9BACT|nr:MAG: type II toxin-antitoxin system antitoxin, RelB/DinJ family [Candidatus Magasanikbacteria bacterium CG10_big_fil_rev_8_21_14_0_10_40_10]